MKKTISLLLCLLMLVSLLAGCGSAGKSGEYVLRDEKLQSDYVVDDNARVFYEIFVGSFSDSDGDGVGDLRGIINRMDYLNDGDPNSGKSLGIEGIWLTPIFQSPSYHKYDVTDYYTVDPKFGTTEDLQELINLCHERNVKLILDLPINHTGSLNKWFSDFIIAHRQGQTGTDAYDFYSWHGPDDQGLAGHRYAPITGTKDYYECNFDTSMPELNFDRCARRCWMSPATTSTAASTASASTRPNTSTLATTAPARISGSGIWRSCASSSPISTPWPRSGTATA